MEDRLQKILSSAGVCSRRKAEEYILAGRVAVNGAAASLGGRADPERDAITVDGIPVACTGKRTVLMLYKPRGVVTTLEDEKGRKTVADLVRDCPARVWPVGRLDMESEGLLLLTDDGELTNRLLHPRHEVEKEYLVWVTGFTRRGGQHLALPMTMDGQALRPATVRVLRAGDEETRLAVIIHEGKNRQIRRMCAACGMTVRRLKRVREGGLHLDRSLRPGQWRPLTGAELEEIK